MLSKRQPGSSLLLIYEGLFFLAMCDCIYSKRACLKPSLILTEPQLPFATLFDVILRLFPRSCRSSQAAVSHVLFQSVTQLSPKSAV